MPRRSQRELFRRTLSFCLAATVVLLGVRLFLEVAMQIRPILTEGPMLDRLHSLLAFIAPSHEPWYVLVFHSIIGYCVGAFLSQPQMQQWVLIAMGADLVTGFALSLKKGTTESKLMWEGSARKFFTFGIVYLFHQIPWVIEVAGFKVGIGTAVGGWYIVHEVVSTTENLRDYEVKIPPFILNRLASAKTAADSLAAGNPLTPEQEKDWQELVRRVNPKE